jgi:hypothetical protein
MFKLYFLTSVADVVASVTLNYQLIQNNLKNSFYKDIGALVPYKTPLRVVFYTWDSCAKSTLIKLVL